MTKLMHKTAGFDEFSKLLKELPEQTEKRILQTATRETLKEIAPEIKQAAPRHTGERSQASKKYGTLLSNIRVARLRSVRKGEKGARISTGRAFWGYIIEMGSRYHAAKPWFTPKFTSLENQMIKSLAKNIGNGIEKLASTAYRGGRGRR